MKKTFPLIYILLLIWVFYSLSVFIGIGIESGYQHWKFYASLIGCVAPIVFLYLFYKKAK